MTRFRTDVASFAQESIEGFIAANKRFVVGVDGGVVRAQELKRGHVAVVVGGGSGHFPAFAGWVGQGLAAAAVCGNVFASPSAGQVRRVTLSAEAGGGVLFVFGNYTGDVLQFGQAEMRLRADGLDVRTVAVTDDIASSASNELTKRRGIAGDLVVVKIAGAAADSGMSLDEVERVAHLANSRTRSIGVAFSGCTLPGADVPLFEVPDGMMAVGLGIHGEPGLGFAPVGSAVELANYLVDRLLAERPQSASLTSARLAVLVNGLGGVKYEELFTLYAAVAARLQAEGVSAVEPECGELVTSLDMAGVSLTFTWLDDELERFWRAPAFASAYSKIAPVGERRRARCESGSLSSPWRSQSDENSRARARLARTGFAAAFQAVLDHEEEWGRIDSVAGDGDHGIGMRRGASGALAAADRAIASGAGLGQLLVEAGEAWNEGGGGTSGALWGIGLTAAASALSDQTESGAVDSHVVSDAMDAAFLAIARLGGAQVGDKTMIDAVQPFAAVLRNQLDQGRSLQEAWLAAASTASQAAAATAELAPRLGRARTHGARSVGHPDAGAVSFAQIVTAVGESLRSEPTIQEIE